MCAWGKMTVEEMKEMGIDPDKLKNLETKLGESASKADVDAVKSTLASIQDSIKALTERSQLETTSRNDNGEEDNSGGNDARRKDPPPPDPYAIDPIEFMADPAGSTKKIIQASIAGTQLHSLGLAADMAYMNARNSLPNFGIFEEEIKKEWDKYPVTMKGKPTELITNIYYLVKGKHVDDIVTDTNKKEGKYAMIQAGGTSIIRNDNSGGTKKAEEILSADEIKVANKWGMTPDEYVKSKSGLKYV